MSFADLWESKKVKRGVQWHGDPPSEQRQSEAGWQGRPCIVGQSRLGQSRCHTVIIFSTCHTI